MKYFERVIQLVERYSSFALPVKLAIGCLITLIAGTGLGFVAEFAAYSWAIYNGLRPPVEGIPYLKPVVTALTVATIFCAALAYLVIHFVAAILINHVDQALKLDRVFWKYVRKPDGALTADELLNKHRNLSFKRAVMASLIITAAAMLLFIGCMALVGQIFTRYELIIFCFATFLALIFAWHRNVRYWISVGGLFVTLVLVPASFYHAPSYGLLLQYLGFGGGIPVQLTVVEDPGTGQQRKSITGLLLLRTTTAVLIYEEDAERVREIPIQQVLYIDRTAAGLRLNK
jgi:hypothetical protein